MNGHEKENYRMRGCHKRKRSTSEQLNSLVQNKSQKFSLQSRVVKITDSWPACHEFEPSTAEDPPFRDGRCALDMSRLKRPPVGGVLKLGEGVTSSGVVLVT
ncbi:hypothetical protein TNCV_2127111 [Trichonephila clavipes]|nr:hypothetical protein TNCV_2127111 [Trichonephila clavipes]